MRFTPVAEFDCEGFGTSSSWRALVDATPRLGNTCPGFSQCVQETSNGMLWKNRKGLGESLLESIQGGVSYTAFGVRPLLTELMLYCAGDVQQLPALYFKQAQKRNGSLEGLDCGAVAEEGVRLSAGWVLSSRSG
ncbi:uncharacterized protein UV8b_06105 [Ustilaginoidea virens]|uniref:Uncharacterized protein n=1 Tax=Ustilaginoidea virens TaxID=1159556 RepID=A0A8E5HUM7_USTVR|nr:uncharacterized protein UV8b_06105 [Ustilaginoidea virens]QUC21864.1 hypothetical protein UV8b_06105 [Ustilaginoidea virens]